MKPSVAVTIAGQRFYLKSDADDGYVRRLATLVDERLRRVKRSTRQVALEKLAILAALQLADEVQREKARRARLRDDVRARARRILALLTQETKSG